MSRIVKICGLTSLDDALAAIDAGADWLGFNFYEKSPRYLALDVATDVLENIPQNITKVGVFVNCPASEVIDIAIELELDLLQFHGDEPASYCNSFARPWIKAIRPQKPEDLEGLSAYEAEYFLVDGFTNNVLGGSGVTANWDLARLVQEIRPIILAGGLTAENVGMALQAVNPAGFDVASGVEEKPGVKDAIKMQKFVSAVKNEIHIVEDV